MGGKRPAPPPSLPRAKARRDPGEGGGVASMSTLTPYPRLALGIVTTDREDMDNLIDTLQLSLTMEPSFLKPLALDDSAFMEQSMISTPQQRLAALEGCVPRLRRQPACSAPFTVRRAVRLRAGPCAACWAVQCWASLLRCVTARLRPCPPRQR
jgi:hypothetical protein